MGHITTQGNRSSLDARAGDTSHEDPNPRLVFQREGEAPIALAKKRLDPTSTIREEREGYGGRGS